MSEVFTFVDSSHLAARANIWTERDKATKERYDKLNNEALPKIARYKDARIGYKGKDKFIFFISFSIINKIFFFTNFHLFF